MLLVDYLAWLAGSPVVLQKPRAHGQQRAQVLAALEAASDQATNPGRIASNVAALGIAWQTFGHFLRERGYWREERVVTWLGLCAQHLQQLAAAQVNLVTDERYSVQFFQAVRGLLATGRAQMQNLDLSNGEVVEAAGTDRRLRPRGNLPVAVSVRRSAQVPPSDGHAARLRSEGAAADA